SHRCNAIDHYSCSLSFKDSANSAIYTLSLHDALPILEQTVHVIPTKTIPQGIAALFVYDEDKDSDVNTTNMLGAIGDVKTGLITDRKSTRLNSSHVSISYAVFCLKKNSIRHLRHQYTP